MEGIAFKCDECGRVAFAPPPYVDDIPVPPSGWIGLSEVPPDGESWKNPPHFCSWACLNLTARQKVLDVIRSPDEATDFNAVRPEEDIEDDDNPGFIDFDPQPQEQPVG